MPHNTLPMLCDHQLEALLVTSCKRFFGVLLAIAQQVLMPDWCGPLYSEGPGISWP